jgi:hypothetical protein
MRPTLGESMVAGGLLQLGSPLFVPICWTIFTLNLTSWSSYQLSSYLL